MRRVAFGLGATVTGAGLFILYATQGSFWPLATVHFFFAFVFFFIGAKAQ